jgi:ABC-type transporter Mla subunit MlaD
MNNAVTLLALVIQNLSQLQAFAGTLNKAISEGRDVTPDELAAASSALSARLDALQKQIDSTGR